MQCWILVHNLFSYMFSWLINKLTAALLYSRTVQLHQTENTEMVAVGMSLEPRYSPSPAAAGRLSSCRCQEGDLSQHSMLGMAYAWQHEKKSVNLWYKIEFKNTHGGKKYWTENYTCTQSFITKLSYSISQNFGYFYWILIGWFQNNSVKTVQPIILNYRRGAILFIIINNTI